MIIFGTGTVSHISDSLVVIHRDFGVIKPRFVSQPFGYLKITECA